MKTNNFVECFIYVKGAFAKIAGLMYVFVSEKIELRFKKPWFLIVLLALYSTCPFFVSNINIKKLSCLNKQKPFTLDLKKAIYS